MNYFAYGSNLLAAWLRRPSRCPSAAPIGPAVLSGHRLVWNKPGADGSAKLNIALHQPSQVWGALYRVADEDRPGLTASEPGYGEYPVLVRNQVRQVEAITFRWLEQEADPPPPFDWYVAIVVEGARRQGLPDGWIDSLAVASRPDPDHTRRAAGLSFLTIPD